MIKKILSRSPFIASYVDKLSPLRRKVTGGFVWAIVSQAIVLTFGVVLNIILARLLPPEQVGEYFLVLSVLTIISTVTLLGLNQAVVKLVSESLVTGRTGRARQAIRWVMRLGILSSLMGGGFLFFGGGNWIGNYFFKSPMIGEISNLLGIWLLVSNTQILIAEVFRGLNDLRWASLFGGQGALTRVLTVILLMTFWVLNSHVQFRLVILLSMASNAITLISIILILRHSLEKVGNAIESKLSRRVLFDLAWPLWINSLAMIVLIQADIVFLGILRPEQEVALYGMAVRLSLLVSMPLMVLNGVLSPIISELYAANQIDRLEHLLRRTVSVMVLPALIMIIIFVVIGNKILGMLFGEFFEQAYLLLVLMSFGQLVNVVTGSCGVLLKMSGHHRQFMVITLVTGIISLPLYYFLISSYEVLGAAIVSTLNLVFTALLAMLYSFKRMKIRTWPQWRFL